MATKNRRASGKKRIRETNAETCEFAKKMLGHFIPYEVGMLKALHKLLTNGSNSQLGRNANIESFHIHARNLMEFFKDDKQCAIDPRTFTVKAYCIEGDFIPKKLENKISQQIVHLTHERTDVEYDKLSDNERNQTLEYIDKQLKRFEKELRQEWLPVWQEDLCKMNFDAPTGLPQTLSYNSGPTGPAEPSQLNTGSTITGPTNQIQEVSLPPTVKQRTLEP